MTDQPSYILRVLHGPLYTGKSVPVLPGKPVHIGHALTNDIVLWHPSVLNQQALLALHEQSADLTVTAGRVQLLGHWVADGASMFLPRFMPFSIGDFTLAYGEEDHPEWARAEALVSQQLNRGVLTTYDANTPGGHLPAWLAPVAVRVAQLRPSVTMMVAIPSVILLSLVATQFSDFTSPPDDSVHNLLRKNRLTQLQVDKSPDGSAVIRGYLAKNSDRARLERIVLAENARAMVDVRTGEDFVRSAEDIFRTKGLNASARVTGPRKIAVSVQSGDPALVPQVQRQALRDIPGLREIVVSDLPPPQKNTPATPPDPLKRIKRVVGGPNGYIVTEDGARYFEGAELPTGHRIVAFDDKGVMVERNGVKTHVIF